MKKFVMLGIGLSGILSATSVVAGGSSFYALSNIASGKHEAPPVMRDANLATIEGGFFWPFVVVPVYLYPGFYDDMQKAAEESPQSNNSNVSTVRQENCNPDSCRTVTIIQRFQSETPSSQSQSPPPQ